MSNPENSTPPQGYPATAAILVLLTITTVMLVAMFSRTAPHPPLDVPPFALGPFLGASLAIGAAAFHLVRQGARYGSTLALLFALMALVPFGPHTYFEPVFSRVWPAAITAQFAVIVIVAWCIVTLRRGRAVS